MAFWFADKTAVVSGGSKQEVLDLEFPDKKRGRKNAAASSRDPMPPGMVEK